jgi:phosphatidylethanolamine-binding protein (PEBP) family uncharacterized protein
MNVKISYKNILVNDNYIEINQTIKEPRVYLENIRSPYTIIMYDPDAPDGNYIHWLIVNNEKKIPYTQPNPPKNEIHNYIFRLYDNALSDKKINEIINNNRIIKSLSDFNFKCLLQRRFLTHN